MQSAIGPLLEAALGAGASIFGASKAAGAQTAAVNKAIAMQLAMFGSGKAALQPALNLLGGHGQLAGAANQLGRTMTPGTKQYNRFMTPITMDEATLEKTPGYQFVRDQGLKSTENSFAARGLGSSGAAMKGAANFATGLADQTYNTRFEQERQNRADVFGRMFGTAELGTGAATSLFGGQNQLGANIGNQLVGAGNAQGAAYTSAGSTVGNLFSQAGGYSYLQPFLNQMFSSGGKGG